MGNGYDGLFGEVSTAKITFPGSSVLGDIVSPFGNLLGPQVQQANAALAQFGQSLSVPGIDVGIGLGDQVKSVISDAPVDPAVPYLYLAANSGVTYGIGKANVSVLGYSGSVVVDPADPSLYVHVSGLPVFPDLALGISQDGYIPFTPTVTPSHFSGQTLYGDFYTYATINLADLTEDMVPITLTANEVVNLDTSGSGWTSAIKAEANALSQGDFKDALPNLNTFALGVNFSGGVSFPGRSRQPRHPPGRRHFHLQRPGPRDRSRGHHGPESLPGHPDLVPGLRHTPVDRRLRPDEHRKLQLQYRYRLQSLRRSARRRQPRLRQRGHQRQRLYQLPRRRDPGRELDQLQRSGRDVGLGRHLREPEPHL